MVEVYQFGPFNSEDGTLSLMHPSLSPTERLVKKSAYDAAVAALEALWNETKLSGNDNSRDYGWPKVRAMVLAALERRDEHG